MEKEWHQDENKFWDIKINKENIKLWIKKADKCSYRNKKVPYIRLELIFDGKCSMRKLIEVMFDKDH
jgi:hypothetical protein